MLQLDDLSSARDKNSEVSDKNEFFKEAKQHYIIQKVHHWPEA